MVFLEPSPITLQGTDTYPTKREKVGKSSKIPLDRDMLVPGRVPFIRTKIIFFQEISNGRTHFSRTLKKPEDI